MRDAAHRHPRRCVGEVSSALQELPLGSVDRDWRLVLGDNTLPEPVMLIRRVLNGQAPDSEPPLPRRRLRRRPLCLLGSERLTQSAEDGTQDAYTSGLLNHDDCCYPNAKGQQKIAELLLATGTDPRALS